MGQHEVSIQLKESYDAYAKMNLLMQRCFVGEMVGMILLCVFGGGRYLPSLLFIPLIVVPRWVKTRAEARKLCMIFQSDLVLQLSFGEKVECFLNSAFEAVGWRTYTDVLKRAIAEQSPDAVEPMTAHQLNACNSLLMFWAEPDLRWIRNQCAETLLDKIWFLGNASTIPVLEEYIAKQPKERLRMKAQVALSKLHERLGDTSLLREAGAPQIAVRSADLLHGIHDGPRLTKVTNTEAGEVPTATEPRETGHHSAS